MSGESTRCQNLEDVGEYEDISLNSGSYLVVGIDKTTATVKVPITISARVVVLGDKSPSFKTENSSSLALDSNGVNWN